MRRARSPSIRARSSERPGSPQRARGREPAWPPSPAPARTSPRRRPSPPSPARRHAPRPQHRDLLDRHRALARRGPRCARSSPRSYFGTSGPASAFTIAFQVPNLVRGLFADAALSAAFVPVFTEYLEHGRKREAVLLASTLFWLILLVLGAITAFFIVAAGVIMPLFIPGDEFTPAARRPHVGLSQVLFPVVVLLGLNGLLVGILNAYHHFTIPAIAPLVWNLVIIGALVALRAAVRGRRTRSTPTRSACCSGRSSSC